MSFNRTMYDYCEGKKRLQESTEAGNYSVQTPVICSNCLPSDPRIMPNRSGVSMDKNVDWRFYAGPIDVESELFNLTRVYSRCPAKKYHPNAKNCLAVNQGQPAGAGVIDRTMQDSNAPNAGYYSKKSIYGDEPRPSAYTANGKQIIEGFANANSNRKETSFNKVGQRCPDNDLMDMPSCAFNTEDTRLSNPPPTLRGTGINRFNPLCFNPQEQIMFPGDYHVSTRLVFRDNHRPCIPSLDVISRPPLPPAKPLPCPQTVKTCGAFVAPMYQYDVCG